MNSVTLLEDQNKISYFFITHFLLLPILLISIVFLYYGGGNVSNMVFILTLLIYSLLVFILGYFTLRDNCHSPISLLGFIFGLTNTIYSLFLFTLHKMSVEYLIWNKLFVTFNYIKPFLLAIVTFVACKFFISKLNYIKLIRGVLLGIIILTSTILIFNINSVTLYLSDKHVYWHNIIKTITLVIIYIISAIILSKQKKLIAKPNLISLYTFLTFITISEILDSFKHHYIGALAYSIILICALYVLYSAQVQYCIMCTPNFISRRQYLYSMNTNVMNRHLEFKELEMQRLYAVSETKDKLYQQVLECAPDAFFVCIDSNIVYANKAALKLLNGSSREEILNRSLWDFIHPDSIPSDKSQLEALLQTDDALISQLKMITLDNQIKEIEASSTSAYLSDQKYIISSVHDLSEIKKQERIKLELESNIEREKFKVEFFANISHDLKTPVNLIYSAAQLQDICFQSNELEKVNMYNNIIKQNCLRLQKLLNDLLDITKIDANHFIARPKPCNIIYLIENITHSVTPYVEQKNLSIIFDTNTEEIILMTDCDLIERVMLNLLSNAIKYGKQDGHIWVTVNAENDLLSISVKDDGIGIPKEEVNQIFERFLKAKNNTTHCKDGSGIGLSLVKAIIEMLDGTISCNSEEGEGSEFIILLPIPPCDVDPNDIYECAASFEIDSKLHIELSDI